MTQPHQEFNEDHTPVGYLITFRSYGTWLHGDRRGSVDRLHRIYGTPRLPPNNQRRQYKRYLWTEQQLLAAIAYVQYDQGEPLP
jgi:hypothetical protein